MSYPPSPPSHFPIMFEDHSALELAVERAAALHEERSYRSDGKYSRVFHLGDFDPSYPYLSVKYDDSITLEAENLTLQYLYNLACEDGGAAPHVPQPVHYFNRPGNFNYMVMGRIKLCVVSDDQLQTKAAGAVLWLRSKRPPAWTLFGSMGKSYAHHAVFQDGTAPQMFNSVAAAEQYLNTAVQQVCRPWIPVTNVSIVNEDVVLTQSDFDASNFGVGLDGRAVLFDAATIQALPVTLADFTLLRTTPFATAVSRHVFGAEEMAARLKSPSMESLAEVRQFLSKTADDSLGVDENGNHRTRSRGRIS